MEPPDPNPRGDGFGVPKVFVRWWPLWILAVILIVLLLGVIPALIGAGPAVGTVPQSTGTTAAPSS
jgi:hypothetical protein